MYLMIVMRPFLRQFSRVTIVYTTCLQLKQNLPTVWLFDLRGHNSAHLNRNLQENLSSTDLCF